MITDRPKAKRFATAINVVHDNDPRAAAGWTIALAVLPSLTPAQRVRAADLASELSALGLKPEVVESVRLTLEAAL